MTKSLLMKIIYKKKTIRNCKIKKLTLLNAIKIILINHKILILKKTNVYKIWKLRIKIK